MPLKDASARRAYMRKYQRIWNAERRARYTDGQKCVVCGTTENINWHHRDPELKVSHTIWTWAIPRLEAELAKCEPRCRTCHNRHHHPRATNFPHGKPTSYSHYGCRCRLCLDAQVAYNRDLKRRQQIAKETGEPLAPPRHN